MSKAGDSIPPISSCFLTGFLVRSCTVQVAHGLNLPPADTCILGSKGFTAQDAVLAFLAGGLRGRRSAKRRGASVLSIPTRNDPAVDQHDNSSVFSWFSRLFYSSASSAASSVHVELPTSTPP